MRRNHVDEYLVWRVDWLERRYWKYTKIVRLSAMGAFLPLLALLVGVAVYGRDAPFTQARIVVYAAVAVVVTMTLMVHAHARNRRSDVEEELAVLYSFPPTQPYNAAAPAPTQTSWDIDPPPMDAVHSR